MTPESIKDLRARLAITQREFADIVGVSIHTIKAWEQGNAFPGADKIERMGYMQHDRSIRAHTLAETLRETARNADLDARLNGEGPSMLAAELRRLADATDARLA